MPNNHLVQWIEEAEARRFRGEVAANPDPLIIEGQYLHLGERIAKISALGLSVGREALSALRSSHRHARTARNGGRA